MDLCVFFDRESWFSVLPKEIIWFHLHKILAVPPPLPPPLPMCPSHSSRCHLSVTRDTHVAFWCHPLQCVDHYFCTDTMLGRKFHLCEFPMLISADEYSIIFL